MGPRLPAGGRSAQELQQEAPHLAPHPHPPGSHRAVSHGSVSRLPRAPELERLLRRVTAGCCWGCLWPGLVSSRVCKCRACKCRHLAAQALSGRGPSRRCVGRWEPCSPPQGDRAVLAAKPG